MWFYSLFVICLFICFDLFSLLLFYVLLSSIYGPMPKLIGVNRGCKPYARTLCAHRIISYNSLLFLVISYYFLLIPINSYYFLLIPIKSYYFLLINHDSCYCCLGHIPRWLYIQFFMPNPNLPSETSENCRKTKKLRKPNVRKFFREPLISLISLILYYNGIVVLDTTKLSVLENRSVVFPSLGRPRARISYGGGHYLTLRGARNRG